MSKNTINDPNHSLPKNTLREIPTPGPNAKEIVGLTKESGRISGYKLSDGKVYPKDEAVSLARQGGIKGVGIGVRSGEEYLKSIPDGTEGNNLSHLPTVSD